MFKRIHNSLVRGGKFFFGGSLFDGSFHEGAGYVIECVSWWQSGTQC